MTYIYRPGYSNRYEVMRALDFPPDVDVTAAVDRANMDAAEAIDGAMARVFFPSDDTRWFDWPPQSGTGGGQYADPWRLWLDDNDLVALSALVSGGVSLPLSQVFANPQENPRKFRPYYTEIELDRAYDVQFGNNSQTPQKVIGMTGTWGYGADADPAGSLASAVADGDSTVTVTDGSQAGPGDLVVLGYGRGDAPGPSADGNHAGDIQPYLGERALVTDVTAIETGLVQSGSGVTTAEDNDQALTWTGTGQLAPGEVITLDSEDMLVLKVAGETATVRRAYAGSTLAAHSGADVYALRQWSVLRAQLGTTAGSYEAAAAVCRHRVPSLVRGLSIAVAENQLLQEGSGYAREVGADGDKRPAPGSGLPGKWALARRRHGRSGHVRQRAV